VSQCAKRAFSFAAGWGGERFPAARLLHYTASTAMKEHKFIKQAAHISDIYRINKGKHFRLKDWDPADVGHLVSKDDADELLVHEREVLTQLQAKLYAQDKWALLVILQGMDAAGKDGVVSHVMSGVNPEGCDVSSFKQPSNEELNHDYLWRAHHRVPERGKIGIFNRSYYEEVLVVRVHPKMLQAERLDSDLVTDNIWQERYEDINAFERYLTRNGILIRKFFLHLSKGEQKKRFLARVDDPTKNWKFSMGDIQERGFWKDYQHAYQELIRATATKHAPWYVVPADNKWYARLVVAGAIIETLRQVKMEYPVMDKAKKRELALVRKSLT
jgi:PPK2 family polyphosphate:nucleotide phosphotransferase